MGWGNCGFDSQDRPIGYAAVATCDHPGCSAQIDRGLSYACGGMHGTSPISGSFDVCEKYFCTDHLHHVSVPGEGAKGDWVAVCLDCKVDLLQAQVEDYASALADIASETPYDYDDWDRMSEVNDRAKTPEDRRRRAAYDMLCNWGDVDHLEPNPAFTTPADDKAIRENIENRRHLMSLGSGLRASTDG